MEPISIPVDQACKLCSIGRDAMVKLMQDPKFPVFKIGNKCVIPVAGLRNYIEALAARHEGVI